MSRIGRKPIPVPAGVKVRVADGVVHAEGPKGKLMQPVPRGLSARVDDGIVHIGRDGDDRQVRALHGLTRSLVANMLTGVKDGFERKLEIVGIGYRAQMQGKSIQLALGYSHPVIFPLPQGIDVAIEKQTHVTVTGIDKQLVGQVAANMRSLRKPDPYKQKGVRYTGEVLKKKA